MKILYITEVYPSSKDTGVWGGGERQFYEISRRIAMMGHEISILTCKFPQQPSLEFADNLKIYRITSTRNPKTYRIQSVFSVLHYVIEAAAWANTLNPDIIHCNTYFPIYAGKLAAQLKEVPLVSTFHDVYNFKRWIESQNSFLFGSLGYLATITTARLSHDRIITVSQQCKEKLIKLGIPREKIRVIPNGVDIALFDSTEVDKVPNQILYVGRLVKFKHVDWLIEAFAKILEEIPDAKLKIVGDGPERGNLERLARKLDIQKRVTFVGATSTYEKVVQHYKESEVFVLPSTVEGEPIVLKEAMAACLPVIAMNIPGSGIPSLIRNGKNGFLLEPGHPELIAEKIILLLQDNELRKKMGKEGRKFAEKYDWNIVARRTFEVYKECLKNAEMTRQ